MLFFFYQFIITLVFYLGKAEEFKVAVVNEKGTGDFSYVTPFHAAQGMFNIKKT